MKFQKTILGLILSFFAVVVGQGQSTMFTYQGRVLDNGANFTGEGQFKFALIGPSRQAKAVAGAPAAGGSLVAITVTDGGGGYTSAPNVSISGGGGGAGSAATATISNGVVISITVTAPGSGYSVPPRVTIGPPQSNVGVYWSNDGSSDNGSEPATAVSIGVSNGLFTVLLGDTNANMAAMDASIFNEPNLQLQIWFSDGVNGFAALNPAQPLTPSPYATFANTASNLSGAISLSQLPSTLVTNTESGVTLNGTFSGDGSGLVNLNASQINGTILPADLPSSLITNNETGVNVSGIFYGNGSGLTNLNAGSLAGTIADALLPSDVTIGGTNVIAPLTVPPTLPVSAVGSVTTGNGPSCVVVAGGYAYLANFNGKSLQVIDVSTPSSPAVVGSLTVNGSPISLAVAGRYAYLEYQSATTMEIVDISNPSSPVRVGSVATADYPQSIVVAGRYAYVANEGASLVQVIDVSIPTSPVVVGSVDTATSPWSIAVAGRYAYVVDQVGNELQVIDVSVPSSPVVVGTVATDARPYSVAVVGRYAYLVNNGSNTLQVVDVSAPSSPTVVGSVATGSQPYSVAVAGRYAYVANYGANTLQVIDVSTPSSPVSIGSVGTGSHPEPIAVSGRYAYVANYGSSTLQIFDMGGAYVQQLESGAMETGTLQTRDTAQVGNNLDVLGGLTVSASARITGGLSVDNGTITASNFTGNAGGLTNLNASSLVGPLDVATSSFNVGLLDGSSTSGTWLDLRNTGGGTNWQFISTGSSNGEGEGKLIFSEGTQPGNSLFEPMILSATGVSVYGTFNNNSDRNAKTDIRTIAPSAILDKVSELPVSVWSYKVDATTRHIGPMAQDFYSAFNVGTDDKHIAPIDEGGVALAAIKGLNQKVEEQSKDKDAQIRALKEQNNSLVRELNELKAAVKSLQDKN